MIVTIKDDTAVYITLKDGSRITIAEGMDFTWIHRDVMDLPENRTEPLGSYPHTG